VFDVLMRERQEVREVDIPPVGISWERFEADVLRNAMTVEVLLQPRTYPFYGLTTAVDPTSRPLLQWDGLEDFSTVPEGITAERSLPRNSVAWYFWHGGSSPASWGLGYGWTKIDAILLPPYEWQKPGKFSHFSAGILFVISAARDSQQAYGGLFPETLRSEFHGVRSVIEAHGKRAEIAGREEGNANGIALVGGGSLTVRVKSKTTGRLEMYRVEL
jgi:hypothetical protein